MAYVPLPSPARAALLTRAEARWTRLGARRPDLEPAIKVQRALIALTLDLLDAVEAGDVPAPSLPPRAAAEKLGRGTPLLVAEPVPVPVPILGPSLGRYCELLASGGASPAALNLRKALAEGRIAAGSLLAASLRRDVDAISIGAEQLGLAPNLVWLVAELATGPFVYVLQQRMLGAEAAARAATLDDWNAGYCPVCGSWPALAEHAGGRAVLRCSYCAVAWTASAGRCVYCRAGDTESVAAPFGEPGTLEVCNSCGGYLKVLPLDGLSPFPLVALSDLETSALDAEAMRLGFARPTYGAGRPRDTLSGDPGFPCS